MSDPYTSVCGSHSDLQIHSACPVEVRKWILIWPSGAWTRSVARDRSTRLSFPSSPPRRALCEYIPERPFRQRHETRQPQCITLCHPSTCTSRLEDSRMHANSRRRFTRSCQIPRLPRLSSGLPVCVVNKHYYVNKVVTSTEECNPSRWLGDPTGTECFFWPRLS